jgi:PAS domain S-box-containing protein
MKPQDGIRKILDHVSAPLLLIDRNYVVVEANRAAHGYQGLTGVDMIGRPCFASTHGSKEPCWRSEAITCPVKEAFASGKRVRAVHKHHIGERVVVEEIVATPVDPGNGEIEYVVEEFRDVTELLELREGLLPICASCKKIRNVDGSWLRIEAYLHDHTGADFSHSLCPACFDLHRPE